ncbi:MAG TPA: DUF721 domain-containing protein [Cyanobacteria bacterium UBA11149]|nr:DUF721 domain-containing protein [Cyanobacteria bacterium UBA11367]HBE59686.1 DUF721 domain-containing protein [Cyanobacteria bacterium UBA11366]HBR75519.1 DUF721 domain-containing protein [Cyanobacteria bacterium UBA11159]HBS71904.1 DUF721 domain-containing protein [Cyanobacteria bacterium UBA11153]HBW89137.1 DUF721 domain-containing protein [Cyanobacteria bacterium UBA11149]HCA95848.1 DUF721 domain-containing protein [Cyanobacteria bacterium UBA9226]
MFESLNRILSKLENQPLWQERQELQQLLACWAEIVGTKAAQETRPFAIARDTLYVATSSSVWVQDLKLKRYQILKQLQAKLSIPFTDIYFSTAQWHQDSTDSSTTSLSQHPSYIDPKFGNSQCRDGSKNGDDCQNSPPIPLDAASLPTYRDPQSAFARWAQILQARSQSLPLCPQCGCPTPMGEIQRWYVCALCAAKQWQG